MFHHKLSSSLVALTLIAATAAAHAQDATLTVRLAVGGGSQGAFNNGGLLATRVTVFARSGFQARLNGPTSLAGPTVGAVRAGGTFSVEVPRLYTPTAAGAPNPYSIELTWQDTASTPVTRTFGPVTLVRGANTVGPYEVQNAAPPAPSSISCYPNPPRTESDLYVLWSGPSPRPGDFDRFELHRSTTAGFTPSAGTLVAPLPWGTSNRVSTGNAPGTNYYFCIRILDQYGAFSDRCTTMACRTTDAPSDAGPDVVDAAMDVPRDTATDRGPDVSDLGADAPRDATADTASDARTDTALDGPRDATSDTALDGPRDATSDTALDGPRDAALDSALDGPRDAALDGPRDAASDVPIDLGGMAGFTSTPPTSAPANTPFTYTARAESSSGAPATMYSATGLPAGAAIDSRTGTITWLPGFGDIGDMQMITVIATLPGGMTVRQSFTVEVTCPDNDGDGRGDARCPMGGDDCDDARADTAPGAAERCNGIDDDCDGRVDEGSAAELCGPGQACDPATRSCRPSCMGSADCSAAPQVCTANRVCALCTTGPAGDATGCAGDLDGRACLVDSLGGIFCGCNVDTDCGGRDSGRVCDVARHTCTAGCGTAGARNGCPEGLRCVVGAGGAGVCTRDCTESDECEGAAPSRPFCPGAGAARTCAGCRTDGDCASNTDGRRYCDATSRACVACVPGRATQCAATGAGAACLAGGVCGCNTDTDCGGASSGRICDTFVRVCRGGAARPVRWATRAPRRLAA